MSFRANEARGNADHSDHEASIFDWENGWIPPTMLSSISLLSLMINITLSPLRCIVSSSSCHTVVLHSSSVISLSASLTYSPCEYSVPLAIVIVFLAFLSSFSTPSCYSNGETARRRRVRYDYRLINYYYYFVYACNHHYTWVCASFLPLVDYPLPLRVSRRAYI